MQENVIFSYVSPHSSTDIPIRKGLEIENPRYASLTHLQVMFPNKYKKLRARARLVGPQKNTVFALFLLIDGRHMLQSEGFRFEMTPNQNRGVWSMETTISLSVPLNRGWHAMDIAITSALDGYFVSGFMLYGG